MANDLTISDLHSDLDRLRRTNSWGNAMISAGISRMNRDLNTSIVGSSVMLYSQLDEMTNQNSMAFAGLSSSIDDLSFDIERGASFVAEKMDSAIRKAEHAISDQIRLSTSRLQLSIDNVNDAVERVNKQINELVKESKVQTTILSKINEGIHNPEIQKTNNGIEDYTLRNFESAVQSFDAALTFRLSLYLPHYYLGLIYSDQGEDNNVYDINKAEKEITDAISYGMKLLQKDPDVLSYMILAHRAYAKILRQKGEYDSAIEQLNKGVDISKDQLETRLLYLEEYVKNFNSNGDTNKALVYARLGFENDASFVSLLVDDDLENLREELLKIVDECRVSFGDLIVELIDRVDDDDLIEFINESISPDDAKSYLGRMKIVDMLKKGEVNNGSDIMGSEKLILIRHVFGEDDFRTIDAELACRQSEFKYFFHVSFDDDIDRIVLSVIKN